MNTKILARIITKEGIKIMNKKEYYEYRIKTNAPFEDIKGGLAIIFNHDISKENL